MNAPSLSDRIEQLFEGLSQWNLACENYKALGALQSKVLVKITPRIELMFNPARVRSTTAKVDMNSVAHRKCFLCKENRPMQQEYLLWRVYHILVNPFPIFPRHLTIASMRHIPQTIADCFADMFALADALPKYSVFFNGACCGASAPDHLHFQAAAERFAPSPLERDFDACSHISLYDDVDGKIDVSENCGRLTYRLLVKEERNAASLFKRLSMMRQIKQDMISVIARKQDTGFVAFWIVPRKSFRPRQYFAEGKDQILVSPASVEIGGVFVLPRREDFEDITPSDALDIMRQVCYESDDDLNPTHIQK